MHVCECVSTTRTARTRTYHDLLFVLDGVEVAGEGEQRLAHISSVVQVSKSFEKRDYA